MMNGRSYTQGQQWYDGCNQICVCEDGTTGFYRCRQRYVRPVMPVRSLGIFYLHRMFLNKCPHKMCLAKKEVWEHYGSTILVVTQFIL